MEAPGFFFYTFLKSSEMVIRTLTILFISASASGAGKATICNSCAKSGSKMGESGGGQLVTLKGPDVHSFRAHCDP